MLRHRTAVLSEVFQGKLPHSLKELTASLTAFNCNNQRSFKEGEYVFMSSWTAEALAVMNS